MTYSVEPKCAACYECLKDTLAGQSTWITVPTSMMILCPVCGNKRCPRATHHGNPCTNSNEPGQPGSRYA